MTSSAVLDHFLSDEQQQKDARDRKRARFNQLISILTILTVIAFWLWANYKTSLLPVVNTVHLEDTKVIGSSALCPGDKLVIGYHFRAEGAGVLVRDFTTWRVTPPPKTIIFSTSRRFILDGPVDQQLRETWTIPTSYFDYESEEMVPMEPGDYRRYMAISSPSRSTVIAIASVDYSIRPDCPA